MDIATMFKHLSPSHANDWIERRAMGWYARRVLGRDTGPMPPQVHAGTAMEKGIIAVVGNVRDAIPNALDFYDNQCEGLDDTDAIEKHRLALPACIEAGAKVIKDRISTHGPIVSTQKKVSAVLNSGGLDWIGYLDIQYEDQHIDDLKYTARRPSVIPGGHARQGAFYSHADDGNRVSFVYVVPSTKGVNVVVHNLDPHDVTGRIAELAAAERAIKATLALAETPLDLAPAMYPDPDHYSMKGPDERAIAADLWGLHQPREAA